ncbi:hypothetical protein GBAR_LOCUS25381 [Geodia barretti]|uniref:Uncharacterized protein n=1 Tax=Geodia barretti TaxID=519541 RepID=A0AA35X5A0_GEOBA|nr:hypothetical protein GBAR_LOCUS25381 [Geodia barretti]
MMETYNVFLVFVIAVLALSPPVQPTRIRSSWSYNQGTRLNYLTKFGVQKGHQVFAYGGSLRKSSSSSHYGYDETLVLAFVPSSTWDKFYHLESDDRRDCQRFMAPFNGSLSSDDRCYRQGNDTADLYRVVPCDHQETCRNQHNIPLVHGSNFTFRIVSPSTQYYYLFLVACIQNNGSQPCEWFASGSVAIDFNVHIVNQTLVSPQPLHLRVLLQPHRDDDPVHHILLHLLHRPLLPPPHALLYLHPCKLQTPQTHTHIHSLSGSRDVPCSSCHGPLLCVL